MNNFSLHPSAEHFGEDLKSETGLELHYASRQSARGATEVRIGYYRAVVKEANRLKIQLVEGVEEISAQFQICLLSQETRQAGILYDAHVHREIARPAE